MTVFLIFALLLVASRFSNKIYTKIETRFLKNLEGQYKVKPADELIAKRTDLAPWDAGLAELIVHANSQLVGLTLLEAKLKENFGVTIALVERGDTKNIAPDRNWVLMPYDKLFVIGSDEQLEKIKSLLEEKSQKKSDEPHHDMFGLKPFRLNSDSKLVGRVIRESGLRELISGVIVGIERGGERILSPDSGLTLQAGDLLWLVGDTEKIRHL